MKRQNLTVRSAAKSSAVACDAHLKDYLPVICTHMINHPLLLKTSVSLGRNSRLKLRQRQLTPRRSVAYTSRPQLQIQLHKLWQLWVISQKCTGSWCVLSGQTPLCQLAPPHFEPGPAASVFSDVFRATPSLCATALASQFRNKPKKGAAMYIKAYY